jgi:hypothetical protein
MRTSLIATIVLSAATLAAQTPTAWQTSFPVEKKNMGVKGNNPNFPLSPGTQWTYKHGNQHEVVTVLDKTKIIDGIESRVVEDREEANGQLVEFTYDYYAIDSATNDVYYMGEDVSVYKNGKLANHEGGWLSGVNGATFGMMLPGSPKVGQRFYQEQAPKAKDRIEIKSTSQTITTPAGTFDHCIMVEESSPLEKGATDRKYYAPGIGPIKDAEMELVARKG